MKKKQRQADRPTKVIEQKNIDSKNNIKKKNK